MNPQQTLAHSYQDGPASRITRDEFLQRASRVEQALEGQALDALIAYSVKNAPGPVAYLAGYESTLGLHDVSYFVLAPDSNPRCALLTNAFWDDHRTRTWVNDILITSDFGTQLAQLLSRSARRVGIAGYSFFPAPVLAALRTAHPSIEFCDATRLVMQIARIKSPAEIRLIRDAVRMTDAGGHAFLDSVQQGATEREIKTAVESAIMLAGSDSIFYGFQVSSGAAAERGMGQMTGRTLLQGDQVQVDCGAVFQGYHGDFSRITTVGHVEAGVVELMETTARMYEAMLECLAPSVPIATVAKAAIEVARLKGMEDYLFRSPNQATRLMGHGIGCWYLEIPELTPSTEGMIEPGMAVVLEPILARPGLGGAKIEDVVLVTADGAERLSTIPVRTWAV